jgi:GTP cyclohydrolase IA
LDEKSKQRVVHFGNYSMADSRQPNSEEYIGALPRPTREEAEAAVAVLLRWIGEDPSREGLRATPARVVRSYKDLFSGYQAGTQETAVRTFAEVAGYTDAVLVRDIPFFSHCEHHMLPVIGKAHVAYRPNGSVIGLSKIARAVDVYARRLQTQEAMTRQVADWIQEAYDPKGVAIMVEASHMCMAMRGIQKAGSTTLTTGFTGSYKQAAEQVAFIKMVRGG